MLYHPHAPGRESDPGDKKTGEDMRELEGKTAVITGGGSGIGREMCHLFASRGCRVFAADVSKAAAEGRGLGSQILWRDYETGW